MPESLLPSGKETSICSITLSAKFCEKHQMKIDFFFPIPDIPIFLLKIVQNLKEEPVDLSLITNHQVEWIDTQSLIKRIY